jgi:hypothetical protein
MKIEIELADGEYTVEVEAEIYGADGDSGADNPDDHYGYTDIEWMPLKGTHCDVYGNLTEMNTVELYEVTELHRVEIDNEVAKEFEAYAKEYAEDAALDAVDTEYGGYDGY